MSWLSNVVNSAAGWGGEDPVAIQQRNAAAAQEAERQRIQNEEQAKAVAAASAPPPPPIGGPEAALAKLNEALGSGFESRYLPDTLDDPFISGALNKGRSTADQFIANMLSRGTLGETGRAGAVSALDKQVPGATGRLTDVSTALLNADRGKLTGLANTYRGQAQQAPFGEEYDPSGAIGGISSTAQGLSSTFGDRFNASLPPGDLFDTSGIGGAGGGVTGPQNLQFDPYAQTGGQLSTGLGDSSSGPRPPSDKKRRTSIF